MAELLNIQFGTPYPSINVAVHHCRRSYLDSRHIYLERHIIFQIEYYGFMLFYVKLTNFKPILTFL